MYNEWTPGRVAARGPVVHWSGAQFLELLGQGIVDPIQQAADLPSVEPPDAEIVLEHLVLGEVTPILDDLDQDIRVELESVEVFGGFDANRTAPPQALYHGLSRGVGEVAHPVDSVGLHVRVAFGFHLL